MVPKVPISALLAICQIVFAKIYVYIVTMPSSIRSDQFNDEWKLVQLQPEEPEMGISDNVRIEKYWNHFLKFKGPDGGTKYLYVSTVIKPCLFLSHGIADVGLGFSKSGCILTDVNTAISLKTVNARLSVCDGMLAYDCKPDLVPVTRQQLTPAHQALASYEAYL